jgi:peptidoglycan/xylan/chitin deacetylase (PgdA/CDA1 family)
MSRLRSGIIRAGFSALHLSGLHRLMLPIFGGVGAIFMMHHVRPQTDGSFRPNSHLEITPAFLRATLRHVRSLGIDIVSIDEAHRRMACREFNRRFACFSFDDGYRDNRDYALPVMREFDAPFTVYVTSEFAEGRGDLWWVALERALAKASAVEIRIGGQTISADCGTPAAKDDAFARLRDALNLEAGPEAFCAVADLCAAHDVDYAAVARELCMSWDELKPFSDDPLVTVGSHAVSHFNIAKMDDAGAWREIFEGRDRIASALQKPVLHMAYPYGSRNAAGSREFALALEAGFRTAVTTRPGMIFPESARHMTALPRVSVNGNFQDERFLPVLTSGAATAMWNGFRRVDAA